MGIFTTTLSILFPIRDKKRIVDSVDCKMFTHLYDMHALNECISLMPFSNKYVRACIHETKYFQNKRAIQLLASALSRYLEEKNVKNAILIPMPLSKKRIRERGYNQVALIAHASTARNIRTDILTRVKHTNPQTTLSKGEREKNVRDAFLVRAHTHKDCPISGKNIILLDDVFTTGATMHAAKATLLPHHPTSITCIAIAH